MTEPLAFSVRHREGGELPARLFTPSTSSGVASSGLVLAHGAGAGQAHPFMTRVASGLAARGVAVVTFDFPYMAQRRRIPDRAPVLERAFTDAVAAAATRFGAATRLFIGGKSMGGRMATHLAAYGHDDVDALDEDVRKPFSTLAGVVVFGYPLHPPGRPDQFRTAHLPRVRVPMLIVQGSRDPFGSPDEIAASFSGVPTRWELLPIEDGDHSLRVRRRVTGSTDDQVMGRVLDRVAQWMHQVT